MNTDTTIQPVQISDIIKGFDFDDFKSELTEQGAPSLASVGKVVERIFNACGVAFDRKVEEMKDDDGKVLCNTHVYKSANFCDPGMKFMVVLSSLEGEETLADTLDTVSYGYRYDTDLISKAINNAPVRKKDDPEIESKTRSPEPFIFCVSKYIKDRMEKDGKEVGLRSMIEVDHIVMLILCGIYASLRRMAIMDVQNQVVKLVTKLGGGLDLLPPMHMNEVIEESMDVIHKKVDKILAGFNDENKAAE